MSWPMVSTSLRSVAGGMPSMVRTSPAASSEMVVISVASGKTTSAEPRSPPPNGYTTVVGRPAGSRAAMNARARSAQCLRYES